MSANQNLRELRIQWEDPAILTGAPASMSGLDMLNAMLDGNLPGAPVALLVNMRPLRVTRGEVHFELTPGEQHYNPLGCVHGGILATLLDTVMACAVHSTLPAGVGYTTLELKVQYIRALRAAHGPVTGIGSLVHGGRQVATAEGRIVDASGKLYAHGSTTCLIQAAG